MKKALVNTVLLFTTFNLAACSSHPFQDSLTPPASGFPVAPYPVEQVPNQAKAIDGTQQNLIAETGNAPIKAGMDENDKSKMLHALDNAVGKTTNWVNENSGISYSVTPTKKVTINGNSLCREYETTASKEAREHKSYGTACVGTDGAWHSKS